MKNVLEQRFWSKVQKTESCWLWTGSKDRYGRGRINVSGKPLVASRVAWILVHKTIPGGHVLHHCDNPSCVNPDHLFLGTQLENQQDSVAKGRHARGETNGRAKLTVKEVKVIRALAAKGIKQSVLAGRFKVSQGHISHIINYHYWEV